MRLPTQPWLRAVVLATTLVFAGVAIYVYAFRFFAWLESDAAVTAILGSKVLHAGLPVVDSWYYANGDVWGVAPHLLAVLPIAVLGLGPPSLLVTVVIGFALELVVLAKVYLRLCGERWVAMFAAIVTLTAWSSSHVAYEYIQLAYGFLTVLYLVAFAGFARLAEEAPARRWPWIAAALVVAAIAVQNPTRGLVFVLAPILAGCAWPWRGIGLRRRAALAGAAIAGWVVAFAIYAVVFPRLVEFSVPRGHSQFVVTDLAGAVANLGRLGHELVLLCGGGGLRAVPGMAVLIGAAVLVGREVFGSRTVAAPRFLGVVIGAQLAAVLVPLVVGNLLDSESAGRYMMPSLLAMFGLAAMLAVRALAEPVARWVRAVATGWLVVVPVAAFLAAPSARPPHPETNVWPDAAELDRIADELVHRGLTRGYSDVLAANLLTLQAGGDALTCPVYFRNVLVPLRWLTDTRCFDPASLPERFYVVRYRNAAAGAVVSATLPPPVDRFTAGDTYEVDVFRTADVSLDWLDLPLPDGELARFPMRLTYLHLLRGVVALEGTTLVATGEPGTIVYGPYVRLPAGSYDVVWTGRGEDAPGELAFLVTLDGGHATAAHTEAAASALAGRSELARLSFTLDRPHDGVEVLITTTGGARVRLDEVVVTRR